MKDNDLKKVSDYINANNSSYIEELKNFLRIKSISTDENHKKDMLKGAEFVSKKLNDAGMNKVRIIKTNGRRGRRRSWPAGACRQRAHADGT